MNKLKIINNLITIIILTLLIAFPVHAKTYTFGIVPQQSATRLARTWIPIIKNIEKQSGLKIKFATAPNIPEFEKRVQNGLYDFAYMNPYHYTVFSKTTGYEAFAKQSDKKIKGILVARKDGQIGNIQDLENKTIAFPAPAAFAATLLVKANLDKNNINYTAQYVSSHDSVYRSVAQGLVPAGGGIIRTLESIEQDIRDQLSILWVSEGYTPHAFAHHPRVSKEAVDKFIKALMSLNQPEHESLLNRIKFNGIEKAEDSDWNDVRALGIDRLEKITVKQ